MSEEITNLLSEISRQFRMQLRAAAIDGEEPTPFQSEVVAIVGRNGGIGTPALAQLSGRDKAQITRIVAELETLGLVRRERSTRDRRLSLLTLTNAGDDLFRQISARRTALSATMLGPLTLGEREQLLVVLLKMRSALKSKAESDDETTGVVGSSHARSARPL